MGINKDETTNQPEESLESGYWERIEDLEVSWKNPPTVEDLKADFNSAEPAHSSHVLKVQEYLKNLAGELKGKLPKNRSKVQPKLIRKQAEWRYATLSEPFLADKDLFNVEARTYEDGQRAKNNWCWGII